MKPVTKRRAAAAAEATPPRSHDVHEPQQSHVSGQQLGCKQLLNIWRGWTWLLELSPPGHDEPWKGCVVEQAREKRSVEVEGGSP